MTEQKLKQLNRRGRDEVAGGQKKAMKEEKRHDVVSLENKTAAQSAQ